MLLSDHDLAEALRLGSLGIEPYDPVLMQPSSIDVRLDRHALVWPTGNGIGVIDPAVHNPMVTVDLNGPGHLMPGQMMLGSTLECITVGAGLAARVEGKSSLGRLGLAVHVTAGFIDPGFSGHVTLELVNHAPKPIRLYPGMRIGQLCVFRLSSPARRGYGADGLASHYQGQRGPTASRSHVGWRTWPTTTEGVRP